jgi:hypothetical protein
MQKGIVYYSDSRLSEPILSTVQSHITWSGLPIVSVTLKPMEFGHNIVFDGKPGVNAMFRQILAGIKASQADVIFLAEHDVLYHPSHWSFSPPRDDTYYYNVNVWRWAYRTDRLITYDWMVSVSGLCAHRDLLLNHYRTRVDLIDEQGWEDGRNPRWARIIGYEPGKPRRRGGFMDEKMEMWRSEHPNIDIRHKGTTTPVKMTLDSFKHLPTNWVEATPEEITGWDLRSVFDEPRGRDLHTALG